MVSPACPVRRVVYCLTGAITTCPSEAQSAKADGGVCFFVVLQSRERKRPVCHSCASRNPSMFSPQIYLGVVCPAILALSDVEGACPGPFPSRLAPKLHLGDYLFIQRLPANRRQVSQSPRNSLRHRRLAVGQYRRREYPVLLAIARPVSPNPRNPQSRHG